MGDEVSIRTARRRLTAALLLSLLAHGVVLLLAAAPDRGGLAPSRWAGMEAWLPARTEAVVMRVDFRESRDYLSYDALRSQGQVASERLPVVARYGAGKSAPAERQLEPAPVSSRQARPGGGNDCWVAGFRFCSS